MDGATGLCIGCARTIDEIAAWAALDGRRQRAIWQLLPARRALLRSRGIAVPEPAAP